MAIDDRKQKILMAIVSLYAGDGEPVGSNLLSNYLDMAVSSATLRNEMATLTKMGLLDQPHTSAGRVPTTKGYRYFLDNLMIQPAPLGRAEKQQIDTLFANMDYEPNKLVQGVARALSDHIGYAVVATTPRADDSFIAHYELTQVGLYTAALLAVTGAGGVLTRVARADYEITPKDIDKVADVLNRSLRFVKEPDVTSARLTDMVDAMGRAKANWPFVSAALTLLTESGNPNIFFEGQHFLLIWQELEPSLKIILELMANQQAVESLLYLDSHHTTILMGDEMPQNPIPGLCVVAKPYLAGSGRRGTLAVLGPTRTHFWDVIPRLEYFSESLGHAIASGNL